MSDMPAMLASGLPGKRVEAQRAGITIAAAMSGHSMLTGERQAASSERGKRPLADQREIRLFTLALGFLFLFVFAFSRLEWLYGDKFFDVSNTGNGHWIWMPLRMADGDPAAFYATREFDLLPD